MKKKEISFTKTEGLGNDFVAFHEGDLDGIDNMADFAMQACDRRLGVGGDGIIIIGPSKDADASFRIFNSDGSEAMMCGNGIRCAAIFASYNGIVGKNAGEFRFKTKSGIKVVRFVGESDVRVDMGEPVVGGNLSVNGTLGKNVSMGNPHFVIVSKDIYALDLEKIGPKFENAPVFPARTNTEFIKVLDRKNIEMRVGERGAGETLACGTGACASVGAAASDNLTYRAAAVRMRGGKLDIDWSKADNHVYMTGPAEIRAIGKFFFSKQRQ